MTIAEQPKVSRWPAGSMMSLLSAESRDRLTAVGFPRSFCSGEQLLGQGALTRHVLVLLAGAARVTVDAAEGRSTVLGFCRTGDVIGEISALDDRPRSATVTATEPTIARHIPHATFVGLLADDPAVGFAVSRMMAQRLRESSQHRADLNGIPVRVRLARVLSRLSRRGDGRLAPAGMRIPISQEELATLVGAASASIHRELAQLRRSGSIETGYRRVVIRDSQALDRMAWDACS